MVLCNCQQASREDKRATLFERKWDRIILDEGHAIKDKTSKRHQAACELAADTTIKWILSATPMQNKKEELMAISKWIGFTVSARTKAAIKALVLACDQPTAMPYLAGVSGGGGPEVHATPQPR